MLAREETCFTPSSFSIFSVMVARIERCSSSSIVVGLLMLMTKASRDPKISSISSFVLTTGSSRGMKASVEEST